MNKVVLVGRLTKDPTVKETQNGSFMARYTLAVDRRVKGDTTADFISCVCFGKGAEFAQKFLTKGMKIGVSGRIQTGSFTNTQGQRVNTFDIVVDDHEFVESKMNNMQTAKPAQEEDDFMSIPDGIGDELPFH